MAASCLGFLVGGWSRAGAQQEQVTCFLPAQVESLPSPAEESWGWELECSIQCFAVEQSGFKFLYPVIWSHPLVPEPLGSLSSCPRTSVLLITEQPKGTLCWHLHSMN